MDVVGWKNGKFGAENKPTPGLSVGRVNVTQYFNRKWDHVLVEVNGVEARVELTRRFWTTCPELRHRAIGEWMRARGLVPWKKGQPPRMALVPVDGNKFRLSL